MLYPRDELVRPWSRLLDVISATIFPRRGNAELIYEECVIDDLPTEFDGFTIVVLADLHHRHPFHDLQWLRHAVDLSNAVRPDLVALLGDYGSSFKETPVLSRRWYAEGLMAMTPELQRLDARHGIVAVLGNHDYYADANAVSQWLRRTGAQLLIDRAVLIDRAGALLRIAGLDDVREGKGSGLTYSGNDPEPPTIVLCHNPDGVLAVDVRVRVDIGIAGHTHGGQIVLPWVGAPLTMSRACGRHTAHGWIPNERAPLYVSRGLGEQLPLPVRLGSPPEIFVLRLKVGQQPA